MSRFDNDDCPTDTLDSVHLSKSGKYAAAVVGARHEVRRLHAKGQGDMAKAANVWPCGYAQMVAVRD